MKITQSISISKASKIALSALCAISALSACGPAPTEPMAYPSAEPMAYASEEPYYESGLASLLTGSIVTSEEEQLRDQLHRKVLLDFPMRVGVIFYDYSTELDPSDREDMFDKFAAGLEETGLVREAVEIPDSLIQGLPNIEVLRKLGARFQTDILILINGRHDTPTTHVQTDFWGNVERYSESKITYQAIALDVFTGTLLSPMDASIKGEQLKINEADPNQSKVLYEYRKELESQVWDELQAEAVKRITTLSEEVAALKASPEAAQLTPPTDPQLDTALSTQSAENQG